VISFLKRIAWRVGHTLDRKLFRRRYWAEHDAALLASKHEADDLVTLARVDAALSALRAELGKSVVRKFDRELFEWLDEEKRRNG